MRWLASEGPRACVTRHGPSNSGRGAGSIREVVAWFRWQRLAFRLRHGEADQTADRARGRAHRFCCNAKRRSSRPEPTRTGSRESDETDGRWLKESQEAAIPGARPILHATSGTNEAPVDRWTRSHAHENGNCTAAKSAPGAARADRGGARKLSISRKSSFAKGLPRLNNRRVGVAIGGRRVPRAADDLTTASQQPNVRVRARPGPRESTEDGNARRR